MPYGPELFPDAEEGKKECSLKILIPTPVVGCIMGKSGEAVHGLEVDTGTKITLSALKDCYPGTKDRVCLISGTVESVSRVSRTIIDKMSSNVGFRGNFNTQKEYPSRHSQVKLIIPQSTASKVIGKSGTTIEKMKSACGSFIQLSRKAFPVMLRERCVMLDGEPEGNAEACRMILKIIADESKADYYKNVSYADAKFPLPNASMSGPPIARANYRFDPERESAISRRDLTLFLEHLKDSLSSMGFPRDAVDESAECILTLSNHRVMDVCLSFMINWFYPRAYAVYERNRGVVAPIKDDDASVKEAATNKSSSSMFVMTGDPPVEAIPRRRGRSRLHRGSAWRGAAAADRGFRKSASAFPAAEERDRGFQRSTSAFPAAEERDGGFQRSASAFPAAEERDRGFQRSASAFPAAEERDRGFQRSAFAFPAAEERNRGFRKSAAFPAAAEPDRGFRKSVSAFPAAAAEERDRGFQRSASTASAFPAVATEYPDRIFRKSTPAFPALCGAATAERDHGFHKSASAFPALCSAAAAEQDHGLMKAASAASAFPALCGAAGAEPDHGIQNSVSVPASAAPRQPRQDDVPEDVSFNFWSSILSNNEGFNNGNAPSTSTSTGSAFRFW